MQLLISCLCGGSLNTSVHYFDFPDDDMDAIPHDEQHNYIQHIEKTMRIIQTKYIPIIMHTTPASYVRLIIKLHLYNGRNKDLHEFSEYSKKIILITNDFAYITKYCNDIVMELNSKCIARFKPN
jgi:hypothetical protein